MCGGTRGASWPPHPPPDACHAPTVACRLHRHRHHLDWLCQREHRQRRQCRGRAGQSRAQQRRPRARCPRQAGRGAGAGAVQAGRYRRRHPFGRRLLRRDPVRHRRPRRQGAVGEQPGLRQFRQEGPGRTPGRQPPAERDPCGRPHRRARPARQQPRWWRHRDVVPRPLLGGRKGRLAESRCRPVPRPGGARAEARRRAAGSRPQREAGYRQQRRADPAPDRRAVRDRRLPQARTGMGSGDPGAAQQGR